MKVLILDQFSWISPYGLQQEPMPFDELVKLALAGTYDRQYYKKAEVREVDESFRPEMRTTVFRAAEDGTAEVWQYRWDTND